MQQPEPEQPNWMAGEDARAKNTAKTGQTSNPQAPRLVKEKPRAPERKQKAFYIQESHAEAFEKLAFDMRKQGIKAPELAEQAIELLLKQYKRKL